MFKSFRSLFGFGKKKHEQKKVNKFFRQMKMGVEALEDRSVPASFTAGNLVVLQAAASANNTTVSVLELSPTTANQTSAVQTIAVDGTGTDAIRVSGSATSTLYLSRSNDQSLLVFNGHNSTTTSSNANTLNPRAVVTFDSSGTFDIATTYTGTSGNQTRSATSLDNSTWFIGDQGGIYTNGSAAASPTGNIRGTKSFGGTVYVGQASSTTTVIQVSTVSAATGGTINGLPGLTNLSSHQDFYLIQSGTNGSTYDVLYVVSATSNTVGTISKFSLVSGSWTANGTYSTGVGGFGLSAQDIDATNTTPGANLFLTTGQGAQTANKVVRLVDVAGHNSTINITTTTDLFTAPSGTILKGVEFAPQASAPSAPAISGIIPGDGQLTVNFTAPTSNGGAAITNYEYSTNNGSNFTPLSPVSATSPLVISGLTNGVTYDVQIRAVNSAGAGAASNTVQGTPTGSASPNQAPVNAVPGAQTVNEDTTLVFSTANSNAISISDADAGTSPVQVTLTVTNGVLTLSGTTGLTGSGNGTGSLTYTGSIADINAALEGLSFLGTLNYNGSATLTITTNDQGNTGTGGALTDSDPVTITIDAVNDAPVNAVPIGQTVYANSKVFSTANGNAITVADIDATTLSVTLTVSNGTLTLSGTTGLTGSGDGTATLTYSGSAADLNAALNGLTYVPNSTAADTLTLTTSDLGATGSGGTLTDADTVSLTIYNATVLAAGDIAFTAFQADGTGGAEGDFFEFVALRDLAIGTTIFFTDNAFASGSFATNENVLRWVAQDTVIAGTKISFTAPSAGAPANTAEFTGINPVTGGDAINAALGLSTSGESITALFNPTFGGTGAMTGTAIAAVYFGDVPATQPTGLILGTNAVSVGNFDNGRYDPAVSGSVESGLPAAIRTSINTAANWEVNETPFTAPVGTAATFTIVDAPEINIQGNAVDIADGDTTPATADDTDFGSAALGTTAIDRTFTIQNLGTVDLVLSNGPNFVQITGGSNFSILTQPSSGTIAAGSSVTFVVRFDPTAIGTQTATLSIDSNDTDEATYNFDVMGTVTAVAAPEVDVRGNSISIADGDTTPDTADHTQFPSTVVGSTSTRTFTIHNTGSAPLTLTGGSFSSSNPLFTLANVPTGTIAAGTSATFDVDFTPTAAGTETANIQFQSDDADEGTYDFAVSAEGTLVAPPALQPGDIAFIGIDTQGAGDADWIGFVALDAIPANQVIYFTDNELVTASDLSFNTGESYTKWVAPAGGLAAGTVVLLTNFAGATPVANVGAVSVVTFAGSDNRGISGTNDTIFAYLAASDLTVDTPTGYVAQISIGTIQDSPTPTSLTSGVIVITHASVNDSGYYSASRSNQAAFADYLPFVTNPANWTVVTGSTASTTTGVGTNFSAGPVTSTTLDTVSPLTVTTGTSITFSGTVVAASGSSTPAGTIQIRDGGANGTLLASTTTIGGTGVNGTYSISSTTVPAGTFSNIQAFFVPNGAFQSSNSSLFSGTLEVAAPIAIEYGTAGSTYTQNFDSLINTGTVTLTGNGPFHLGDAQFATTPVTGWYFSKYSGTGANALYRVDDGVGSFSGSIYSYGTTGQTDRALGSLASGSTVSRFGAILRNTTGLALDSVTITFDGEQWRDGVGSSSAPNSLSFEYKVGSAPGDTIDSAGFTADTALNFTAPVASTSAESAVDGNAGGKVAGITKTITGISWPAGTDLIIRWYDVNDTGNDDGLGIDNVSISAASTSPNGSLSFSAPTYNVTEDGVTATITVNRLGNTSGAISATYATVAGGTAVAGTDYTTTTGTVEFQDGSNTPQTFTIPISDNLTLNANKTINLALSNPQGGATIASNSTAVLTIRENEMATQVILNEILVNPSTSNDRPYEFVEVRGTPSTTLANYYVVQINGTPGSTGNAHFLSELSDAQMGSNGLLVVKAATGGHTVASPTTSVTSTLLDVANGRGLLNNAQTVAVIFSPTPIALDMDLDTNDDGTLDLPSGAVLVDAVGWKDNSDANAGLYAGFVYGGVELFNEPYNSATSGTPDAATRFVDNATPLTFAAWYNGDMQDTGDPSTLTYDPAKGSANMPVGAASTPGVPNSGLSITPVAGSLAKAEGDSGLTAFQFTIARVGDLSNQVDVTWTVTGSGTNPASADDFENGVFATGLASLLFNEASTTITINVTGDLILELSETFTVTLSNPTNGAVIVNGSTQSAISNDDFQTIAPGEIVITGINTSSNPDQFSFVPLVNLTAGGTIVFTDKGWDGSALITNEGSVRYVVPAGGVSAGTKVVINANGATSSVVSGPGTVSSDSGFSLSTTGENLFAYVGLETAPSFIFGLTTNTQYLESPFLPGDISTNTTFLPSSLTVGTSAVAALGTSGVVANAHYTGATAAATATELRDLVANVANWTTSATPLTLSAANFSIGDNAAPTDVTLSANSIAENAGTNAVVGTLTATDPDVGDTFTFSLLSGASQFNINGNELRANASFNFETGPTTYVIDVRVTDSGTPGLTFDKQFTITVTNVNEAPTNLDLSSTSVAENLSVGTTVGTFQPTDPDAISTFTYAFATGTGDTDNASFTLDGNQLKTASVFDFETKSSYSIRVTVTDQGGLTFDQILTISVTDVLEIGTAYVTSFVATSSGFIANFSQPLVVGDLNLYDQGGTLGAADVTVVGNTTGAIRGSLLLNAAGTQATFVKTGTALANDTYTVTLRSNATNGFRNSTSGALDGNADGTGGDNYVTTFTVTENTASAIRVSLPDFARGFGQDVNVPAASTGLPLNISTGQNVLSLDVTIAYDPTLLNISGFTLSSALQTAGVGLDVDTSTPGQIVLAIYHTSELSATAGSLTLGSFTATVPSGAAYPAKQVVRMTSLAVFDTNAAELPSVADDAVHIAGYFGDASGNRAIQSNDAALVARIATGGFTGTTAFQLADPAIVLDVSGNGTIQSNDAALVARRATGQTVTQIPTIPTGLPTPPTGVDPTLSLGSVSGAPGSNVVVPLNVEVPSGEPAQAYISFDVVIQYDATKLTYVSAAPTSFTPGWSTGTPNNPEAGILIFSVFGSAPTATIDSTSGLRTLMNITFTVAAGATGTSPLNLREQYQGILTALFDSDFNEMLLTPAPSDGVDAANDGVFTVMVGPAAPTDINLTSTTIPENSGPGATVGTFSSTDANAGDTHTYTLVTGAGDTNNGLFTITNGVLTANSNFNFESGPTSYSIRVRSQDQGGLGFEKIFTIFVTNVNEAPTLGDAAFSINENSANGTPVGTVTAIDVDVPETLTYTITAGNTGNVFAISNSGAITVNGLLNFEGTASYTLTIQVTDAGLLSDTATVTITLNDLNEAPTVTPATFTVREGAANGSPVGTAVAVDPDTGATITYAITAGNSSGAFAIDTNTGAITVADGSQLDFSTTPSYSLTVEATDNGNLTGSATVTVNVEAPIYLNEIYFNPQGTDSPNEFFELRGPAGMVIPAGTYLVGIEGDAGAPNPGDVQNIFDLSGRTFGTNGLILFLQKGSTYNTTAATTAGTTVVINVGTGAGWGSGATSSIGHTGDTGTDLENGSVTYLLIRTSVAPTLTDDIDNNDDGTPNGAVFAGWNILDSIGALQSTAVADFTYAAVNVKNGTGPGTSLTGPVTLISGEVEYAARFVGTTGMTAASWLAGDTTTATPFRMQSGANVMTDNAYRGSPLDHIGLPNNFTLVAPTDIALSAASIDENSATATVVGTFTTTDPSIGDTHTYTLVTGTGDVDNLSFTIVGNELRTAASFDFETKASYSIRVRTTDSLGITFEKVFTISVNDANETPTLNTQTFSIAENSAAGTSVGSVLAGDPDALDSQSFAATGNGTGASLFIISAAGEITLAAGATLDFESTTSYSFEVTVTDGGGLFDTEMMTIDLTDVNEAPTVTPATYTIAENTAAGVSVGTVSANDVDALDTVTYAITGGNTGNAFTIDANTGEITVATSAAVDFEVSPTFSLTVTTTDSGLLVGSATITINLTNVNEAPTIAPQTFTIAENSANTSPVGTVIANDVDVPETLTYAITAGNGSGAFQINASTGAITVADGSQLDFEATTSYSLTVSVTDAGLLSDSATITINVTNVNEAPTVSPQTFSIAENTANATPVGTVIANDVDVPETLTYAITGGNGSGAFQINASTGQITVADSSQLGFETTTSYSLTVSVTDAGLLSASTTITIDVTNVNEAPTVAPQTFSIAENSANATPVGTVVANDVDVPDTLTYAITAGNGSGAFAIDVNTGAITVADGSQLDFETTTSYNLTVSVTDVGLLSASATVTINVTNENEAPTIAPQTFTVLESATNGTFFGTVATGDPDANDTKSFVILSGNTNSVFAINAAGQLSVNDASQLDFNTTPSYSLSVQVTDGGGLSATATITVNVSNVNQAPTISPQTFTVPENSANGTSVGTVVTGDPDAGDTKSFLITAGNASGAFQIDATTGEITVANGSLLDFEGTNSYALTVQVTDGGALSASATITINLTNVNEAPVIAAQTFSVLDTSANGKVLGTVLANDPDAGTTLVYAITAGNGTGGGVFAIDSNGQLTVADNSQLNFFTTPTYSLTVEVSDGSLTSSATITVGVTNINRAPTALALSGSTVVENSPTNTTVGSLSSTDPDSSQTFTYTLVSGFGSTDNASFNISGNLLRTSASFNYEVKSAYSVRVRTTDQSGASFERVFTILVTNENERPTDVNLSNQTVSASAPAGTQIGTLTGIDPDANNTFTYTIGGADAANFTIVGNSVRTTASYNGSQPTYAITITAVDQGGLAMLTPKAFTITRTASANSAPTALVLSNRLVAENVPATTTVGVFTATDTVGDTHTFAFVGGFGSTDNASFTISGNTLRTVAMFNYEAKSSYSVRVRTTDAGGLYLERVFTILVTNANEAATDISLSNANVSQTAVNGTQIGNFTTIDPDVGNTFTYTLSGTDAASFTVVGATLRTSAAYNGSKPTYSITVTTTDQGGLSFAKAFTITRTAPANTAPTALNLVGSTVLEGAPIGTVVGSAVAVDSVGDTITYSLVTGYGSNDNGSFTINPTTGAIATGAVFDFETKSAYSVRVRATDQGGLFYDRVFTLRVTNVNETPTNVNLSSTTVSATAVPSTIVGTLTTVDPDAGNSFTYTIVGGTEASHFTIVGDKLRTSASYSGLLASYSVTIRSTDQNGLIFDRTFTITH